LESRLMMSGRMILGAILLLGFGGLPVNISRADMPATAPATMPAANALDALTPTTPGYPRITRIRAELNKLNLTDDQQAKIAALLNLLAQQLEDLSTTLDPAAPAAQKQAQINPLFQAMRQQLRDILTPGQLQKFNQAMAAPAGAAAAQNGGAGGAVLLQNLRSAIASLDLTADERQQLTDLLKQTQTKVVDLRQGAAAGEDIRPDIAQLRTEVTDKLQQILTPDQMAKVRDLMQQAAAGGAGAAGGAAGNANNPGKAASSGATANAATDNAATATSMIPGTDAGGDGMMAAATTRPAAVQSSGGWDGVIAAGVNAGDAAPDFSLKTLDGRTAQLSDYKDQTVVIEFGSISSPTFRAQAANMEKLHAAVGTRVAFLIVYTREVYPDTAQLAQNIADKISVAQPAEMPARIALASRARDLLHISLPIAVDTMDNPTATAFGGFPNGAVIIKNGTVVERFRWANADSLQNAIDRAAEN
jgi:Spy/CpxP family protein refolding chaperone